MMLPHGSFSGMNRRNALALARVLGCSIVHVHASGEIRISHALIPKPLTMNGRRKDSGRKLTSFLKFLVREVRAKR